MNLDWSEDQMINMIASAAGHQVGFVASVWLIAGCWPQYRLCHPGLGVIDISIRHIEKPIYRQFCKINIVICIVSNTRNICMITDCQPPKRHHGVWPVLGACCRDILSHSSLVFVNLITNLINLALNFWCWLDISGDTIWPALIQTTIQLCSTTHPLTLFCKTAILQISSLPP